MASVGMGVLSAIGFAVLAFFGTRAGRAERETVRHTLLLSEVHHRVKNNLQIVASFIDASRRQPGARQEQLTKIAAQVRALATLYDIMQTMPADTRVEVNGIIERLCATVARSTDSSISFSPGGLAADFSLSSSSGFGLHMVRTLAGSVPAASVDVASSVPAVFRVRWPLARAEAQPKESTSRSSASFTSCT